NTRYPSRLLDVGQCDEDKVKLFNTKDFISSDSQNFDYIALSYHWGVSAAFRTTKSSQADRECGFSHEFMPRTLRETVQATRDLGFRYLWIDALCILQAEGPDDEVAAADWKKESVRMNEVYGGAALTIVAAGSSDCDGGLFRGRPTSRELNDWHSSEGVIPFHDEPLASRAWTFQEWILSKRLLVFSTSRQGMHFVCTKFPMPTSNHIYQFNLPESAKDCTYSDWATAVVLFSRRNLTNPADKLPAISGVAKRYAEITGKAASDYLAGLWRDSLPRDLLWSNTFSEFKFAPIPYREGRPPIMINPETGKELPLRTPSWSWAAIDGFIDYNALKYTPITDSLVISCDVTPGLNQDRFGQIHSETLVMRCWYVLASFPASSADNINKWDQRLSCVSGCADSKGFGLLPGDFQEVGLMKTETPKPVLYCLLIAELDEFGGHANAAGIVVRFDEKKNHFYRVGLFEADQSEFDHSEEREFEIH
ncbi:heterokaryon incompatibility protein-domain-containing protein, partial [Cladorrhinum sp. PSN259]